MTGLNIYFLASNWKMEDSVPICSKRCMILICSYFLHACNFDLLVFFPRYLKFVTLFSGFVTYLCVVTLCCILFMRHEYVLGFLTSLY
jgi:hypothetical protein